MSEDSKKKLVAALITLGICTAATACGYVDNMSSADAAKLQPAIQSLNVQSSIGTNMVLMMEKAPPLTGAVKPLKKLK